MTNKELFYFTARCLVIDEHPYYRQQICDTIAADGVEWEKFVALCSNHYILPAIYLKFKSHQILELLPGEMSEYLKEIYELNRSRNEKILNQLRQITAVLNKSNIYPVFLKGAAHLLDQLYADIGERILKDIDILVPGNDYLLSAQLLENDGYACLEDSKRYFDSESLKHYPALFKPGFVAHLEIHRQLIEKDLSWFNHAIVDPEKKEVKSLAGCYVLSDRHQAIHNFAHGQLQHGGHINGIISLRDLYDFHLLSKRISVEEILRPVKCKQKAIAYYVFAARVFGPYENAYRDQNFSARLLLKKHDLNLTSPTFYHLNRGVIYLVQRIIIGQTSQFIKAFYSADVRRSIIRRLSSRRWYIGHLQSYARFFKGN